MASHLFTTMRKKILVTIIILLTFLASLALTSCSNEPYSYFPLGIWDEYEW